MILPTLASGLINGSYVLKWINANLMRITHSRNKSVTNYFLGESLKDDDNFKDLGVTITKDLSRSNHISITVNKANKVLGSVKRFSIINLSSSGTKYLIVIKDFNFNFDLFFLFSLNKCLDL